MRKQKLPPRCTERQAAEMHVRGQIGYSAEDLMELDDSKVYRVTYKDPHGSLRTMCFTCQKAKDAACKMKKAIPGAEVQWIDIIDPDHSRWERVPMEEEGA